MKKIKDLTVTMTYRVGLSDLNVSDEIYNGLEKISEMSYFDNDKASITDDEDIESAYEWLTDNIKERDAFSWEYEIEDLTE